MWGEGAGYDVVGMVLAAVHLHALSAGQDAGLGAHRLRLLRNLYASKVLQRGSWAHGRVGAACADRAMSCTSCTQTNCGYCDCIACQQFCVGGWVGGNSADQLTKGTQCSAPQWSNADSPSPAAAVTLCRCCFKPVSTTAIPAAAGADPHQQPRQEGGGHGRDALPKPCLGL